MMRYSENRPILYAPTVVPNPCATLRNIVCKIVLLHSGSAMSIVSADTKMYGLKIDEPKLPKTENMTVTRMFNVPDMLLGSCFSQLPEGRGLL